MAVILGDPNALRDITQRGAHLARLVLAPVRSVKQPVQLLAQHAGDGSEHGLPCAQRERDDRVVILLTAGADR